MADKPSAYRVWIPKTAGTSIHYATHENGRPHVTVEGALQKANLPGYTLYTTGNVPPLDAVSRGWATREWLSSMWTFGIVRNPWERFVSIFHYREDYRSQFGGSFTDFILGVTSKPDCIMRARPPKRVSFGWPQSRWLLWPDGKETCDTVLRQETLADEWPAVASLIGLPVTLGTRNVSKHGLYTDYYTDDTLDAVALHEKYVISKYGYRFGE